MKLNNIKELIDNEGEITVGRIGPVRCGASACDESNCLAMLARRPGESFEDLLERLDSAIEDAIEHDIIVDEINQ
ncbi:MULTISPECIES: hypothetical protein [Halomonadaceae]|uniref:hypothetical protein n=1 Tax=Halomonadaceae TaxID=28256 RepID=UPI000C349392|nr:hypothetical protein [Halomonas sp. MES3-P3E]PKG49012.1 hypothetical protein CXF87_15385 [Halomonas sp. MES3-P3E]|tara:strand:+ start:2844 stop:3068 length:225 start_codon:yes stop_codon:yes gene_type:complete